jgi:hypothetical protein
MKTQFSTTKYQFSHMKLPRGRGSWAFFFSKAEGAEPFFAPPFMTYTEAKKVAAVKAKELGVTTVYVGS